MSRRKILAILAIAVAGIGWYLFRPEKLFVNQTVSESFPSASATVAASTTSSTVALYRGHFNGVAHKTNGVATVYKLPDGKRVLRLSGLETSNGPNLKLYLVAAADATDSDTVKRAGFVSLGTLKGNRGDQNYDVPAGIDFNKYRAVTIWCRRFGVNFATAPLQPASTSGDRTQPASTVGVIFATAPLLQRPR